MLSDRSSVQLYCLASMSSTFSGLTELPAEFEGDSIWRDATTHTHIHINCDLYDHRIVLKLTVVFDRLLSHSLNSNSPLPTQKTRANKNTKTTSQNKPRRDSNATHHAPHTHPRTHNTRDAESHSNPPSWPHCQPKRSRVVGDFRSLLESLIVRSHSCEVYAVFCGLHRYSTRFVACICAVPLHLFVSPSLSVSSIPLSFPIVCLLPTHAISLIIPSLSLRLGLTQSLSVFRIGGKSAQATSGFKPQNISALTILSPSLRCHVVVLSETTEHVLDEVDTTHANAASHPQIRKADQLWHRHPQGHARPVAQAHRVEILRVCRGCV